MSSSRNTCATISACWSCVVEEVIDILSEHRFRSEGDAFDCSSVRTCPSLRCVSCAARPPVPCRWARSCRSIARWVLRGGAPVVYSTYSKNWVQSYTLSRRESHRHRPKHAKQTMVSGTLFSYNLQVRMISLYW